MTTKMTPAPRADVGVIVGRFQVHELHEAHKELIKTVSDNHDRVIVFIGLSPLRNTTANPMDFNTRKRMFSESFPNIEVYYVEDCRDDAVWSKNLDREITKWLKPSQTAVLYGGRDSFIRRYTTKKFPTAELESTTYISGTEIRRRVANNFPPTKEFRAGMISASFNRYPTCYTTVDVAVIDWEKKRVLLGRKPDEAALRFLGGFSSPDSPSFEADARREVSEEAGGIEIGDIRYLGSLIVDDWRYRGENDKIKTLFFVATYVHGRPEGGDDIAEVSWVDFQDVLKEKVQVVSEHVPLMKMLHKYLVTDKRICTCGDTETCVNCFKR